MPRRRSIAPPMIPPPPYYRVSFRPSVQGHVVKVTQLRLAKRQSIKEIIENKLGALPQQDSPGGLLVEVGSPASQFTTQQSKS